MWGLFFFLVFLVLMGGFALWVWSSIKHFFPSAPEVPTINDIQLAADITDGDGNFTLEVVGEFYNQDASHSLRARPDEIRFARYVLYPEKRNQHDANAVAVWLNGAKVGHLSKPDAISYRYKYGAQTTQVLGIIQGGRINDSVWLDADLGSGQETKDVFDRRSANQSFPIKASKTDQYSANLSKVMDGNRARLVEVMLTWDEDMKNILVFVEALPIAQIGAKLAASIDKHKLPGKTIAMITCGSVHRTVRVSDAIVPTPKA